MSAATAARGAPGKPASRVRSSQSSGPIAARTPGAAAGIEPGALLAGVDGRPIGSSLASYCAVARNLPAGTEVTLSFAVPNRTRTRQVRLRLR
ncbi:MAG: hypothetical protein ABR562_09880 [Thermoplasmatota archaeon]